jgi:predicted ATPase
VIIGFFGSHGTGKTTTADIVSEKTGCTALTSKSRDVGEVMPINREASHLSQLLITTARGNQAMHYSGTPGLHVADRTPLDSLAYTQYQIDNIWPETHDIYINESKNLVRNTMWRYTALFYFPVTFHPEEDGTRDGDVNYQDAIDYYIRDFADELGFFYHTVPNGTAEERADRIIELLGSIVMV